MRGDGDGYTRCEQGHDHWGKHGAAGLLIRNIDTFGQMRFLLTLRSPLVHEGGCYGIPGGAIDSHESPEDGANREAHEELDNLPGLYNHQVVHVNDHGGWSYVTVLADSDSTPLTYENNWETDLADWFNPEEVDKLPLHSGFAETWRIVRATVDICK